MILQVFLTVLGLAIVIFGAESLVDGASSTASKERVSCWFMPPTSCGFSTLFKKN